MFALFARRSAAPSRTFFHSPHLHFPPAKSTSPKPTPRGRPPTKQAAKKSSKDDKQRLRVPKDLKPPKRAPGPYFLFYTDFLKTQPHPNSLPDSQALAKRAGEIWKGYSMAEKQPFYDENEARKAQAKQALDHYFDKTSPSDLKKLNAIRKAQGRNKIHSTRKFPGPSAPFILFSNEFRMSSEGQEIIDKTFPEKKLPVRVALAAAARWKTMSDKEKAPYFDRHEKAKDEWKAGGEKQAQA